jgi:hypothetical protein
MICSGPHFLLVFPEGICCGIAFSERPALLSSRKAKHLGRGLVLAKRCAHLHALHHAAHLSQHLLRDQDTLSAGGFRACCASHAGENFLRHPHLKLVAHKLGILDAGKGPDARDHGDPEAFDAAQEILQQPQIEDGLGDGEFTSRLHFGGEAAHLEVQIGHAWIGRDAKRKSRRATDRVAAQVEPLVQIARNTGQSDGIHVKDGCGIGIGTHLRGVAGEAENILEPDGCRAQQIALNRKQVAVAAGVVQHGFDAHALLNLYAQAHRAHPGTGAWRVGHVDGIDAKLMQLFRAFQLFCAVKALRWNDFDHRAKLPGGDHGANLRAFGERRRLDPPLPFRPFGGRALDLGHTGRLRVERPQRAPDSPDVLRRRPTTSPHKGRASLDESAREAGQILGRGEVEATAIHRPGRTRVGHRRQWKLGRRAHPFKGRQNDGWAFAAVASYGIRSCCFEQPRRVFRTRSVETVAIVVYGHHHDNGQTRSGSRDSLQRKPCLAHIRHRLHHQQIRADSGPARGQRGCLFGKGATGILFADTSGTVAQLYPERAHRPGHESLECKLVAHLLRALAGQPNPGPVDIVDPGLQAKACQAYTVGTEGIGLQHLGPGLQIFHMHGADELGLLQIQLVVAAVDKDPTSVQHGPHGSVAQHGPKPRTATGQAFAAKETPCGILSLARLRTVGCRKIFHFHARRGRHQAILKQPSGVVSAGVRVLPKRRRDTSIVYTVWYTRDSLWAAAAITCRPPQSSESTPLNNRSLPASPRPLNHVSAISWLANRADAVPPLTSRFVFQSRQAARSVLAVCLLALVTLGLSSCGQQIYRTPEYTFSGRPVPPSLLLERVMVALTPDGSSGRLEILDGLRDIRNNVQNTIPSFQIAGYSGLPTAILNFPEEQRGYVYSNLSPYNLTVVNYSTEASAGNGGTFNSPVPSVAVTPDFVRIYGAGEATGQLILIDNSTGASYGLNLPNVYRVAVNRGDTVALAMVRNSNTLYRVVKLNANSVSPPGAVDCEPTVLPVYCVLPVQGSFDRPYDAYFSVDGSEAYILNCGLECGGGGNGGSSISQIPQGALQINTLPTSLPYPAVITNSVAIPGGVTTALSDGTNLYLAGQQMQPDGLFAGRLTVMPLATFVPGAPVPISDGTHSKLLFADDNTLWIGSQNCSVGERAHQASLGVTGAAANYNCLTRYDLGAGTASIVPALASNANGALSVPYPNQDENLLYLGSLTGICWVQNYHKVYTAYGGQVHAFNTVDGSEINNVNIIVQGTALDVAYMDALTNSAN